MDTGKRLTMLEKFIISHCLKSEISSLEHFVKSHPMSSRVMTIGEAHRGKRFWEVLEFPDYIAWVQKHACCHEDLQAFKVYSEEYLKLKETSPEATKVTGV